ncbi:MAG TPA: GerMN domain-containing protein [Acidimicrobiales bacterium]|nr:GerMN domain-containing protein [Acidimicrobiales bacterium]
MRRPFLVLVAALLLSAGCGLSENSEPRVIAAADVPEELIDPNPATSTTVVPSPTTTVVSVYYVVQEAGQTRLIARPREVADASRAADRLAALLLPPTPDEVAAGILTSIPADTVVIDTDLVGDELVVDLSASLFDVQGEELRNAFAQLVWTATELDSVRRVRFRVDGQDVNAPDANGIEQSRAVQRGDYVLLAPG